MTDTDRLAELAAEAPNATYNGRHLTWVVSDTGKKADPHRWYIHTQGAGSVGDTVTQADAEYIVALHDAWRSLVDDNRELRAALDETQRMLEYLWSATGNRAPDMPVHDLFNEDDPITDNILTVLGRARMLVHGATPAPRTALHPGDGT